jgi:hypothetical protein
VGDPGLAKLTTTQIQEVNQQIIKCKNLKEYKIIEQEEKGQPSFKETIEKLMDTQYIRIVNEK